MIPKNVSRNCQYPPRTRSPLIDNLGPRGLTQALGLLPPGHTFQLCFLPRREDVFKVQMLVLIVSKGICKLQKCQTCTWPMCHRQDNLDQHFCVAGDAITPLCARGVTRSPRVLCAEDHGWGGVRMCGLAAPWPSMGPAGSRRGICVGCFLRAPLEEELPVWPRGVE